MHDARVCVSDDGGQCMRGFILLYIDNGWILMEIESVDSWNDAPHSFIRKPKVINNNVIHFARYKQTNGIDK